MFGFGCKNKNKGAEQDIAVEDVILPDEPPVAAAEDTYEVQGAPAEDAAPPPYEYVADEDETVDYSNTDRIYPRSPNEAIQPEAAPSPPKVVKKRRPITNALNGIISAIIFFLLIGVGILMVGYSHFSAPGPLTQDHNVIIPDGDGLSNIATRLVREGVISDTYIFMMGVIAVDGADKLKAGEFLFKERASMRDVMQTIIQGRAILHGVTIPEGRTSQQIVEILRADPMLIGDIVNVPAEGTLLPETYKFTRGTSRQSILLRMGKDMKREVARLWAQRDESIPLSSPEDMVILASIVEKETGRADERPHVASVFVNRMRQGIKLQSDPTIIYGLVGGQGSLGRPIRRSEIDRITAYNTYQIQGLPPTPIANPGLAALEATANPSRTNDLFFVADGAGGHAFAETLAEHNQNVVNWRAHQRQAAEDKAAQEEAQNQRGDVPTGPPQLILNGTLIPPIPELMPAPQASGLTPPPQRN